MVGVVYWNIYIYVQGPLFLLILIDIVFLLVRKFPTLSTVDTGVIHTGFLDFMDS